MSAINHFIKKGVRQSEIDAYLGGELQRAGYGGVEIAKTPLGERITIHAARPGIVIGRRGKNIRTITDELVNRYGLENPQIEVKEVANPELNAKVMAYSLVSAIERGVHRRRAAYSVLRRVLNAGAKGCEIIIAGKLTSKRSRHEAYRMGLVAKSGDLSKTYVMSAKATAVMKLGTIGVTVDIMRGDVHLPDDISLLGIQLEDGVIEETITEEPEIETPVKEKKAKAIPVKEEAASIDEVAEKKPKADKVVSKKTDLDKEVEELSDLIEKTPGEEVKPKKAPAKTETKKVEKETAVVDKSKTKVETEAKKATETKTVTTKSPEPKKTEEKSKTTKDDTESKDKKKPTKKEDSSKDKKTTKKDDDTKDKKKAAKKGDDAKDKKSTKKEDDAKDKKKATKKDDDKKSVKESSSKKDEKSSKEKSKKDDEKKK